MYLTIEIEIETLVHIYLLPCYTNPRDVLYVMVIIKFTYGIVILGKTSVYFKDFLKDLKCFLIAILCHQKLGTLREETETGNAYQRWYSAERQEDPPGIIHKSPVPNGK